MKVMMLQNDHFSPLLPLIQTFSKTRGIFNRAASEARSEAAASDSCLFLMWFQKTKQKLSQNVQGKLPSPWLRPPGLLPILPSLWRFPQWFLYTPNHTLEELTLSSASGWSEVHWSSGCPLHLWCPALTLGYSQEQLCFKGISLPKLPKVLLSFSLKPQLGLFTCAQVTPSVSKGPLGAPVTYQVVHLSSHHILRPSPFHLGTNSAPFFSLDTKQKRVLPLGSLLPWAF